jgi:hypothetical protein
MNTSKLRTCNDLLVVRSDAYVLTDEAHIELVPERASGARSAMTRTSPETSCAGFAIHAGNPSSG